MSHWLTKEHKNVFNVIPAKAGIQTSSLRKQGTIIKWDLDSRISVFTGIPGSPDSESRTGKSGMTD
jgi:hypothetical protein